MSFERLETARRVGQEVTIDQYPYTASSTSLSTLQPADVQANGHDSLRYIGACGGQVLFGPSKQRQ